MIQQLIAVLGSDLELTAEEVADLLWLTLERHKRVKTVAVEDTQSKETITIKTTQVLPKIEDSPFNQIKMKLWLLLLERNCLAAILFVCKSLNLLSPEIEPPTVNVYASTQTTTSPTTRRDYVPLAVADARSLREPLDFIRALKPLLKQVPSQIDQEINEPATVDWIAQTGLWMPILQPSLEPWLELALVIDESNSMILWRHVINELQQVLKHYGMFRDVRVWGMSKDKDNQISLRSQTRFHSPKELIDPQNRRLIMVVSDVIDDLWRESQIISLLAKWTGSNPVVLLQMLPEWMWSRTALGIATSAQLHSSGSSILNSNLIVEVKRLAQLRGLNQGINLPVITLESERAKVWSRMLAGQSDGGIPGYVLRADLLAASNTLSEEGQGEQRVSNFITNASPLAQRLAGFLAAAPIITMPVVRLIQDSILTESNQIQIAEVFLGGLLKPIAEITPETDPEQVQYEFIEKVRLELLKSISVPDGEKVFDQVSRYVAKGLGKSLRKFVAWLRDPSQLEDEDETIAATVKPFAKVAQEILQQLGYQFVVDKSGGGNSQEEEPSEPPLEIYSFEVLFLEIARPVEFEVATLEYQLSTRKAGWVIRYQQHQATRIIEDIAEGIELELIEIPGGTFFMGTEDEEIEKLCKKYSVDYFREEKPQHKVTVPTFLMGKYQITQGQWQAVANMTHLKINHDLNPEPAKFTKDPAMKGKTRWDRPVESVNWYDAKEFCDRLSLLTQKQYTLPSEAQWEYACRSVSSKDLTVEEWNEKYHQPFYFGETITGDLANYDASRTYANESKGEDRSQTTPVGIFPPNAFGLYDMHGNVWEWCEDDYHSSYDQAPTDGNAWLKEDENTTVVLRGGSWVNLPWGCRCAFRNLLNPDIRDDLIGLRVVRVAPRTLL